MKKTIFTLIIIVISIISCNNKPNKESNQTTQNKGFQIDVTIDDAPDGVTVYLKKNENKIITIIDSTQIKNNKFSFSGKIDEPIIFGIFIKDNKKGGIFPFTDVNDHIYITAFKDSLYKSEIKGSKLHDELKRLRNKKDILNLKIKQLLPDFQKAKASNDKETINHINKKVRDINDQLALNDWIYVKNHPNSFITPLVFEGLLRNPKYKDSLAIVFNSFNNRIRNAKMSKAIKDQIQLIKRKNN